MLKRVCLYGGPGIGKSTVAAQLFVELKILGYAVELVDEAIKGMAWQKLPPKGYDAVWLFGKQVRREDVVLRSGGLVVTGGALLQQVVYMRMADLPFWRDMLNVAKIFEFEYPALHVHLMRAVPYQVEGRYQPNVEEARKVDVITAKMLSEHLPADHIMITTPQKLTRIVETIVSQVSPPKKEGT